MEEIWKDIKGFEGLYQVSNLGRVKSFRKWKRAQCPDEYFLKPYLSNNGYYQITLYDASRKKKFLIHRLVAEAFIPNPDNKEQVNHKDENTLNNCVENLEWCDARYNNNYGTAKYRAMLTRRKPVSQYLVNGEYIATYASLQIAESITGIPASQIAQACNPNTKAISAQGFLWKYCSSPYAQP